MRTHFPAASNSAVAVSSSHISLPSGRITRKVTAYEGLSGRTLLTCALKCARSSGWISASKPAAVMGRLLVVSKNLRSVLAAMRQAGAGIPLESDHRPRR